MECRVVQQGERPFVAFDPVDGRSFISAMSSSIAAVSERKFIPIVLCLDDVRPLVKYATEREMPSLVVLSYSEVVAAGNSVRVETLGDINVQ